MPREVLSNIAYSYARFSSPAQADGDSVRRQTALRDAWLARHPHVKLDKNLTLVDRGVSGFKGSHRTDQRHALAQFLDLVERRRIPAGAWLLIESLDRATREEPSTAVPFILSLVNAGIRIVTLSPTEVVYEKGMDMGRMVTLLLETFRVHGESARKQELCGAAWQEKKRLARVEKKPIGKSHPAWIALESGRYVLRHGAAAAVKEIFRLAALGKGTPEITRILNRSGVPAIGKTGQWVRSYVQKILTDRTVLGEYQPCFGRHRETPDGEPIENYYPAAVTWAEWAKARASAADRLTRPPRRRSSRIAHPFQGLLVDALDDCQMYTLTLKGRKYAISQKGFDDPRGENGKTHRRPFPLDVLQTCLLSRMREIAASDLFDDESGGRVRELETQLADISRKLSIASARFDADPENSTWQEKVDEYDRARRVLVKQLAEARAEASSPLPTAWVEAVELMSQDDPERLCAMLRRTVEEIRMLVVKRGQTRLCAAQVFFAGGSKRDYVIRWTRSVSLPHCRKPELVEQDTFASAGLTGKPDLRKPADVKRVAAALERLELKTS